MYKKKNYLCILLILGMVLAVSVGAFASEEENYRYMFGTQYTQNYRGGLSGIMNIGNNLSVQGIVHTGWWRRSSITARGRYMGYQKDYYGVYGFGGGAFTFGAYTGTDFSTQLGAGVEFDLIQYLDFLREVDFYNYLQNYPPVYNLEIGAVLMSDYYGWNGLFLGSGLHFKF